jgi:E3 ubiquitin-protein ligase HERC2
MCVTEGGAVLAFGANRTGQLGVGDSLYRIVPTLLRGELENKSVLQVAAGNEHTVFVTADGLVLVCGHGGLGQLGAGDKEDRVVPTLVRGELEGRKVLRVAAGGQSGHHTMCLTEDGLVFTFGNNYYGQLGVGDTENRLVPTLLRGELENKSVLQVAAGLAHTIFVAADGLVFTCGGRGQYQRAAGWGQHIRRQAGTNAGYKAAARQSSSVCCSRR